MVQVLDEGSFARSMESRLYKVIKFERIEFKISNPYCTALNFNYLKRVWPAPYSFLFSMTVGILSIYFLSSPKNVQKSIELKFAYGTWWIMHRIERIQQSIGHTQVLFSLSTAPCQHPTLIVGDDCTQSLSSQPSKGLNR